MASTCCHIGMTIRLRKPSWAEHIVVVYLSLRNEIDMLCYRSESPCVKNS